MRGNNRSEAKGRDKKLRQRLRRGNEQTETEARQESEAKTEAR